MDDHDKETIGKAAGLGVGALSGARIGGVLIPIPLVGSFAGAVVGGAIGTEVGKRVGKAVLNAGSAFVDTLKGGEVEAAAADT